MGDLRRIGLLSDSHGHHQRTAAAVQLLVASGAQAIVHLGDINTLEVLEALVTGLDEQHRPIPPVHIVFGNTDFPSELAGHAAHLGLVNHHPAGALLLADGRELVFTHGDRYDLLDQALQRGVGWLCHGHTHRRRDDQIGPTRIINPGALVRCDKPTCCLLETDSGQAVFLDVPL